jgi:hypothetical protein
MQLLIQPPRSPISWAFCYDGSQTVTRSVSIKDPRSLANAGLGSCTCFISGASHWSEMQEKASSQMSTPC